MITWRRTGDGGREWVHTAPWLLDWVNRHTGRCAAKIILDRCHPERGPMFVRYPLVRTRWGNLYLHHFVRSDNDRHYHDHPWSFTTWLLTHGYYEHTPGVGVARGGGLYVADVRTWRRRWSLLYRPATWRHFVEIDGEVWTLVWVSPRCREWGFWTASGWIDWVTYGREWCD